MIRRLVSLLLSIGTLLILCPSAQAVTLRVTPGALERTLQQQLFTSPDHRFFLRGRDGAGCPVYAQDPQVSFRGGRVVVHIHLHARIGPTVGGVCLGLGFDTEADVTLVPVTDGENLGFDDPRLENLDIPHELLPLVSPFLSRKLPQQMRFSAAGLLRKVLESSRPKTGYDLQLQRFTIESLQLEQDALVLVFNGELSVE